VLNQGQQAAADGFFQFLFDNQKEMIISGPGGVGKTYLMGHLIDRIMPEYMDACKLMGLEPEYDEVNMTAMTNKAAEVLSLATKRPTSTIHSFLGLKPQPDFKTGEKKLVRTSNWRVRSRQVVFIDEAYMIDAPMLQYIREAFHKSKIVYVGDHCQLPPVQQNTSSIHGINVPFYELTEPMRNAGQPALIKLAQQLRTTVETGDFQPIEVIPGVVDWVDDQSMESLIQQHFHTQTFDARILAFSNKRVNEFNDHIRGVRGLPYAYTVGENLVSNSAIPDRKTPLTVEQDLTIIHQDASLDRVVGNFAGDTIYMKVVPTQLKTRLGTTLYFDIPEDREHFHNLIAFFKRNKMWPQMYQLQEGYPDLRPRDAATVHKAQGSTYETVFIDVGNISTCNIPSLVARMLYVAITRAKSRVILYGNLAGKYGGIYGTQS
jgi:hypothetical protein